MSLSRAFPTRRPGFPYVLDSVSRYLLKRVGMEKVFFHAAFQVPAKYSLWGSVQWLRYGAVWLLPTASLPQGRLMKVHVYPLMATGFNPTDVFPQNATSKRRLWLSTKWWNIPGFPVMSNQHYLIHAFEAVRIHTGDGSVQGTGSGQGGSSVQLMCWKNLHVRFFSEVKAATYLFSRTAFACYCAEFWPYMEFGSFLLSISALGELWHMAPTSPRAQRRNPWWLYKFFSLCIIFYFNKSYFILNVSCFKPWKAQRRKPLSIFPGGNHYKRVEPGLPRFYFPCLCHIACRILVAQPGIECRPQLWKCWVLTTGMPGNFPRQFFLCLFFKCGIYIHIFVIFLCISVLWAPWYGIKYCPVTWPLVIPAYQGSLRKGVRQGHLAIMRPLKIIIERRLCCWHLSQTTWKSFKGSSI